jgi:hypothetical protein
LGSDSSGSEDDAGSIPVEVALQALNEEAPEEGWTSVVRRRKKSEKEADEGMTARSSIFAYLVPVKEEARSKDT